MTGYTVNTGATTKFSEGWDRIFSGRSAGSKSAKKTATPAKAAAATPAPKKSAKAATKAPKAAAKTSAKPAGSKTVKSKQASQQALTSGKR